MNYWEMLFTCHHYHHCYLKSAYNSSKTQLQIRSDQISRSVMSNSLRPHESGILEAARQASLSITNSRSSLRLTSIKSVMPSSHLILCCPLLLSPPIPPSIRVFSNESTLRMRWPKYWSFNYSAIKKNTFESVLMKWMKLEPIIQSEGSQK